MKINIFPIASSLHQKNYINQKTKDLLSKLENLSNHTFNIVNIDNFYDADLSLILVQSGGSEQHFLENLNFFKPPYYILTYGHNNSLAASLEILSYLKDSGLPGKVIHGSNEYIIDTIENLLTKKKAIYRYGVIGKPSDWLIASNVDYNYVLERFDIKLVDIGIEKLIELYHKTNIDDYDKNYTFNYNKLDLDNAKRLYVAINKIKEIYNLDGLTIRCFDLLNTINTTACLGFAILNADKIVSSCEGDIPTMLSMHLIKKWFLTSSFQANPCRIDITNKTIVFAHCTLPLDMAKSYELDSHYESKIGVALKAKLREEKVTIFKLSRNLKDYYVETGTIVENLEEKDLCRSQIKILLDQNIEYFLNRPYGNHHIIIYGDYKEKIIEYMSENK